MKHGIKLLKISTTEQLRDKFTKGLPKLGFEYLSCWDDISLLH